VGTAKHPTDGGRRVISLEKARTLLGLNEGGREATMRARTGTYSTKTVSEASRLLDEYDDIRQTAPTSPMLKELEQAVIRLTGAPSLDAARIGLRAFEAAKLERPAKFKPPRNLGRPRRRSGGRAMPTRITRIVSGGLPGNSRRN
jgi:hypothetical protein